MPRKGECVTMPVAQLEYREGGNTIWIHGAGGSTVLRIKTNGSVKSSKKSCNAPEGHADIQVDGDIVICRKTT